MQQNRDRNGRPRNTRPYDLNRDVARTSAPSQDHTPRSTGSSRYGYNGEPLSRPPSRSANGGVRSSRADNSIQFPRQGRQMSGSAGQNGAGRPRSAQDRARGRNGNSGTRPANGASRGAKNGPSGRMRPTEANLRSPSRRESKKKRKLTRAAIRRRRIIRRLTAFALLLCVIAAGVYLTVTKIGRAHV